MTNGVGGYALARGAARGLGSLWPLVIPAVVIGFVADALFHAQWWVFVVTLSVVVALWYFVIAKIPGQLRVRTIRRGVLGAIIFSARIDGFEFARTTTATKPLRSSRPRVGGTAVVASDRDIQLWRGPIGNPFSARAFPWTSIETIAPAGRRGELAIVLRDGDRVLFRAMNNRPFLPTYAGRAGRTRLIAAMLGLKNGLRGREPEPEY
jgi:hypothetical protein